MSASNYVLHKMELAAQAFLQANAPVSGIVAAKIHVGQQKAKREAKPACVICYCPQAQASANFSGEQEARLIVQLRSDSDSDANETLHHARAEAIYNLIASDTIAADLSAALDDFTAFLVVPSEQRFFIEDPHWVSELEWVVHCCGSDIG